jgi:hypothetical protein
MLDQNHQIRLACRYVVDGKSVLEGAAWVSVPSNLKIQN